MTEEDARKALNLIYGWGGYRVSTPSSPNFREAPFSKQAGQGMKVILRIYREATPEEHAAFPWFGYLGGSVPIHKDALVVDREFRTLGDIKRYVGENLPEILTGTGREYYFDLYNVIAQMNAYRVPDLASYLEPDEVAALI